jgi:hypothetical protein
MGWVITGSPKEARRQKVALAASIAIGDPKQRVVDSCEGEDRARVRCTHLEERTVVHTRRTFLGLSHWILWFEYRDRKVSAVRFRGHDGRHHRLPDAPPDREAGL